MINLESEFSPRVNPADANYPFGSIKDNSSPGANDGTPLAAVWGNDWEGFAQAAMTEAGITPSGLPDTAQDSQLLAAVKAVASGALRPSVIEALRRSYAEAGYDLIGDFSDVGLAVTTVTDVVMWEPTGIAYAYSGTLPHTIAANETPVGNPSWVDKSNKSLRSDLATAIIYVRLQGGTFDGVINNTTAIMQAHTAANLLNATVSYAGIKDYAIDANAQIPINTNVDFCGARCHILNGIRTTPDYQNFYKTYVVEDPNCPVITASGTFTGSLARGSRTPTKGLFNGEGVAYIEAPYLIPNRNGDGTVNYKQSFHVIRDGECTLPLSVDLTGFESQLLVTYRKASPPIKIQSPTLVEGGFNNLKLFHVNRCNIDINNFTFIHSNGAAYHNINTLISLNIVADVRLNGVTSSGQPVTTSKGSYVLNSDFAVDCKITGMVSPWTGWPSTASNHCNGLSYSDCDMARVDGHEGIHNLFVDNCRLFDVGVTYGWGGGVIKVTNCTVIDSPDGVVATRNDYGGNFFGDVIIDNIVIQSSGSTNMKVINIQAGASIPTFLPEAIKVTNIHWAGKTDFIRLVCDIKKTPGSAGDVYAPVLVNINNITSSRYFYISGSFDYDNMIIRPGVFRYDLVLRGVRSGSATVPKGNGILVPAGAASNISLFVDVSDSSNILFESSAVSIIRQFTASNTSISGVDVNPSGGASPMVELLDCEFRYPAGGYAGLVPVGGAGSAGDRYTRISGGTIGYAGYDFSKIEAAEGVLMLNGSGTAPLLPSGWTPDDMFNGRKSATRFRSTT